MGQIAWERHGTLGSRSRTPSSGFVACGPKWQCGRNVVSVRVRRRRIARGHVCEEQRDTHFHGGSGLAESRAQFQRILPCRGSCCSSGNRASWRKLVDRCEDCKIGKGEGQNSGKKGKGQKARASRRDHHDTTSVTRPAIWVGTVHLAGKALHVLTTHIL